MMMGSKILRCREFLPHGPETSVGQVLVDALASHPPSKIALLELRPDGERYTYDQLRTLSMNLAAALQNLGIDKTDNLCIMTKNTCRFWAATLASMFLGAPLHLLNPAYTNYELRHLLPLSKPKLVFCSELALDKCLELRAEFDFIQHIVVLRKTGEIRQDVLYFDDLISVKSDKFKIVTDFDVKEQVVMIFNSSGTTGRPKGVMITHSTINSNLMWIKKGDLFSNMAQGSGINITPFYHIYGNMITFSALYAGAENYIMEQFKPEAYIESIAKYKVQVLYLVPTLVDLFSKTPLLDNYDVSSVREIFLSAGTNPQAILDTVANRFNVRLIRSVYGMTETGRIVCVAPADFCKSGSCGLLCAGYCLKVIDTVTGEMHGACEAGELCIKGPYMKGYLGDVEQTQQVIDDDGFLHTGDIGYYDQDGFVFIIDRLKDFIKYKSFQVPPVEIEELVIKMGKVADVAVVGKPDQRYGELPVAFVVKKSGVELEAEEVVEFVAEHVCMEKRLHGGVRFIKEIPRTAAGKIMRRQLRELI